MFYVYILYSHTISEYYCGQCNNMVDRLYRHNNGETKSIKHGRPWILIGYLVFNTRREAMSAEKRIKQRGIRRWLDAHVHELVQPG